MNASEPVDVVAVGADPARRCRRKRDAVRRLQLPVGPPAARGVGPAGLLADASLASAAAGAVAARANVQPASSAA